MGQVTQPRAQCRARQARGTSQRGRCYSRCVADGIPEQSIHPNVGSVVFVSVRRRGADTPGCRQYAAISVLQRQLPIGLLLKCMSTEKYPTALRACFCRYGVSTPSPRAGAQPARAPVPLAYRGLPGRPARPPGVATARRAFRLMLNIHINCDPFESIPAVRFARLWSNIGTTLSPNGSVRAGAQPPTGPMWHAYSSSGSAVLSLWSRWWRPHPPCQGTRCSRLPMLLRSSGPSLLA